jgi:hypothetical protein
MALDHSQCYLDSSFGLSNNISVIINFIQFSIRSTTYPFIFEYRVRNPHNFLYVLEMPIAVAVLDI